MGRLKIKEVAILNEDNPEFLAKLMRKGVDAVKPEMEKQIKDINKEKMKIKEILKIIDEFFNERQKQVNDHIAQFGKDNNRDIDTREKSTMLMMVVGYRKALKEKFVLSEESE